MLLLQVFMDLKESSSISYYSAFLFLTFGGILNTLPLLQIYLDVSNSEYEDENQLEVVLNQLSVTKYLLSSSLLHQIYIVVIFSFHMLILFILIILLYKKKCKKFINIAYSGEGKFLLLLIQPLFWSINGMLFQILNAYLISITSFSFIDILDIAAIFLLNVLLQFLEIFFYFDHTQKKNFLKINQLRTISIYNFLLFFSGFQELFKNENSQLNIAYPIILFLLYSMLYVSQQVDEPIFHNSNINQYFSMITSIQYSISINLLLFESVEFLQDRYCILVLLTFVLLIELNFKIRYINVIEQIENYKKTKWIESNTVNYIKQNPKQVFLLRGLLQIHQSMCLNINCFCRIKSIYKISSKGNKKILINRQTITENVNRISSFLLKCVYESKLKISPDHRAKYLLIELLCFKLKLQVQALVEINSLNFDKINIIQKVNINNIRIFVDRQQFQKNGLSYKSKLPFDHLLNFEKYIKESVQIIITIFGLQLEFWNYSLSLQIHLQKELIIFKKIFCLINEFQRLESEMKIIIEDKKMPIRNKQWFNYFFYKLFIMNKKLKVQELEIMPSYQITLEQILKDDFADEKSSDEEITPNYYNEKFLISANTCVIQINNQNIVKNCTNSTYQLLNKTKENLLNRSATIIMPTMFKQNHQQFIHHFQQTGESMNLYNRRKAFCVHENGSIIIVQKYSKAIYNYVACQIEYIAMFRQIQTKSHYLLLNNNWEIDSATQLIHDVLGIKNISLFIMAPKTILYSPLKKFLNKQNRLFFFLNKQDSNIIYTQNSLPSNRDSVSSNNQATLYQMQLESKKNFQKFLNQDDVIHNEDYSSQKTKNVLFNLRVPKHKFEIMEEYEKGMSEIYKRIVYGDKSAEQLLIKTTEGQHRINRSEFIKRSKMYQFFVQNEKFALIKRLFQKYTQQEDCIDKILRVEGILKSTKTSQSLSYILLKIIRIELIEENQHFYRQNTQFTSNLLEKQFTKGLMLQSLHTRKSMQSQQSPKILNILTDQGDLQTNRDNTAKFLLPDMQINLDFEQLEAFQVINFLDTNSEFLKEDTNKIEKKNSTLTKYIILSRLLFACQILVAFLCYFQTSYFYNTQTVNSSIILIDYLYEYQVVVAESYNAEIDIYLFNKNITNSILINDSPKGFSTVQEFYSFNTITIEECADFMYFIFIEPDFLKMLYENFFSTSTESGLDIQTLYQANLYLLNMSQLIQYKDNDIGIADYFRQYMLPQFQTIQEDSIKLLFSQGQYDQQNQNTSYILLLAFQSFLQVLMLLLLIKFQLLISKKYDALFRVQAMIPYNDKLLIIEKIHLVIRQFCYITKCEYGNVEEFLQGNNSFNQNSLELRSERENKKIRDINNALKVGFIKQPSISIIQPIILIIIANFLLIGIILLTGIVVIQMILSNIDLFQENQFMINCSNIWVIPAIKEIITKQQYPDYNFNDTKALSLLREFKSQMMTDYPLFYDSNIDEIIQLIDSNVCDRDTNLNLTQCYYLLDGALTRGIRQYDYLLSQVVDKILEPNDGRYDKITYDIIYEFNKLYYFVIDHFLLSKDIWVKYAKDKISYHDEISLIFLIIMFFSICSYFIVFNEIFYIKSKKKEYQFIKRFYKSFIPNSVMNQQKRLRVELIKNGFIKK